MSSKKIYGLAKEVLKYWRNTDQLETRVILIVQLIATPTNMQMNLPCDSLQPS